MTPKVIFFDINETLLDMQAIKTGLASVLNGDETLVDLWFANLLHHSLVDVASGQFHDFIDIGAAALTMVAHSKDIFVDEATAKDIIKQHITRLPAHDDVVPTLKALQSAGVTLVALSNSSKAGLDAQLEFANIKPYFSHVLSVESVRTYKPHAAVYHWACQQANVKNEDAMMVAAHGWDVSGAKATGMQTAFVERSGKMMYPLGLAPDHSIASLTALIEMISS
ncbi:haloacid dehalogenase type II [Alteromonas macleodii]|uniref:(S)-2-haloacid dehalogenase n=1 Tax=Alteromonas macleodii TaxID=28108 RepID=A0AB36G0B4_ALTMA|nr:haloacid dehalogenase type II [Alteromonas macleodii]NOH56434.1 haloacid dehalogenase type II [Alteromonas sp. 07-89-2]AMN10369.1 HAD family hydrolase [Alteromonas macleodii]OES37517.1 haloacid dehalogenase, type II [Alteromonas macleodii]OES37602.1 haloacid dehalogenase, type II [Alteromonas macleodii]OES37639.1 haloacid dehalogenase, type II [Alteromonas macleodii]